MRALMSFSTDVDAAWRNRGRAVMVALSFLAALFYTFVAFPGQPDRAQATAIANVVMPGHHVLDVRVPPATYLWYGQPVGGHTVDDAFTEDVGEFAYGRTAVTMDWLPASDRAAFVGSLRRCCSLAVC